MTKPLLKDRYQEGSVLGAGDYGIVFKGIDTLTNNPVAIKRISTAKISGRVSEYPFYKMFYDPLTDTPLCHPNLVCYYDAFYIKKYLYIIMDFVDGSDFRKFFKTNYNELTTDKILDIMRQLINGLTFLHDRGIAHNDIKDENILIDKNGTVKITDYGLACFLDRQPTCDGRMVGNILYKSLPLLHKIIYRNTIIDRDSIPLLFDSDLWAIGLIFYQLINKGQIPIFIKNAHNTKDMYIAWIKNPILDDIYKDGDPTSNKLINDVVKRILYIPTPSTSATDRPSLLEISKMLGPSSTSYDDNYDNLDLNMLLSEAIKKNINIDQLKISFINSLEIDDTNKTYNIPNNTQNIFESYLENKSVQFNIIYGSDINTMTINIGSDTYGSIINQLIMYLKLPASIKLKSGDLIMGRNIVVKDSHFNGDYTIKIIDYTTWPITDLLSESISRHFDLSNVKTYIIDQLRKSNKNRTSSNVQSDLLSSDRFAAASSDTLLSASVAGNYSRIVEIKHGQNFYKMNIFIGSNTYDEIKNQLIRYVNIPVNSYLYTGGFLRDGNSLILESDFNGLFIIDIL